MYLAIEVFNHIKYVKQIFTLVSRGGCMRSNFWRWISSYTQTVLLLGILCYTWMYTGNSI